MIGGIWCAGRDEAHVAEIVDAGARFGSTVLNCQLHARHASGHPLSDREVADFYLRTYERGEPAGCLPSLEVHVDMWSEDFTRVARVARLVEQAGVPFRITLDHSHLLFKIGNHTELDASGIATRPTAAGGCSTLHRPTPYADWIACGWVRHARSVMPNNPDNPWMRRADGRPGRGIQYPFVAPHRAPITAHGALRRSTRGRPRFGSCCTLRPTHSRRASSRSVANSSVSRLRRRRALFDLRQQRRCAHWLRDTWHAVAAPPAADVAHTGT